MKQTNIVSLVRVRSLFTEWEKVKEHFRTTKVAGFQISVIAEDGSETIFRGGLLADDTALALKAMLRMSAARMQAEDEPLRAPRAPRR